MRSRPYTPFERMLPPDCQSIEELILLALHKISERAEVYSEVGLTQYSVWCSGMGTVGYIEEAAKRKPVLLKSQNEITGYIANWITERASEFSVDAADGEYVIRVTTPHAALTSRRPKYKHGMLIEPEERLNEALACFVIEHADYLKTVRHLGDGI